MALTRDEFWRKKNKAIRLASQLAGLLVELGLDRAALTVGAISNRLYKYTRKED